MENNFNFEIFETPALSTEEIQQKEAEKEIRQIRNSRKNLSVKIAGTVAAVIILIIAVLLGYLFTAPVHNPEKLIKKYVNEINSGEWEKAYSRLYFYDSTTISKNSFVDYCTNNPDAIAFTTGKIIDFNIEKAAEAKDSPEYNCIFYNIDYLLEDGSHGTFYLSAEKINEKPGKLAKYGIKPEQSCFASLEITVPQATAIKVNNIEFNNATVENGNYIYKIKYNFVQPASIHISNPFCNEIDESIELKPGTNNYDFTLDITEDCFNQLNEQTKNYISSLYTDIINGKEDFSEYPLSNDYKETGFSNDLEEMKSDVFYGNYTVSNFTVTEASPKKSFEDIDKAVNGTKKNEIEIKYTFKYSYTYTYNDENGNAVSADKTDSGYFGVKYILGDKWYISDISSKAWF